MHSSKNVPKFQDAQQVLASECKGAQDQASTGLKQETSQGAAVSELNLAMFEQNGSNYHARLGSKKLDNSCILLQNIVNMNLKQNAPENLKSQ